MKPRIIHAEYEMKTAEHDDKLTAETNHTQFSIVAKKQDVYVNWKEQESMLDNEALKNIIRQLHEITQVGQFSLATQNLEKIQYLISLTITNSNGVISYTKYHNCSADSNLFSVTIATKEPDFSPTTQSATIFVLASSKDPGIAKQLELFVKEIPLNFAANISKQAKPPLQKPASARLPDSSSAALIARESQIFSRSCDDVILPTPKKSMH